MFFYLFIYLCVCVWQISPPEPVLRRLFLFHPEYPTILQELTSTTDTALTATGTKAPFWIVCVWEKEITLTPAALHSLAVSYDEEQKDVSYVVVVSRPVSGLGPGVQLVKSVSVRASLTRAATVRLSDDSRAHTAFQIDKFFKTLSFRRQVRSTPSSQAPPLKWSPAHSRRCRWNTSVMKLIMFCFPIAVRRWWIRMRMRIRMFTLLHIYLH